MKSLRIAVLFVLTAVIGTNTTAQMPRPDPQSQHATETLNRMVAKFHAFLSMRQKLVYKQKTDQSPSKAIYVVREVTTKEVSSDFILNDSLDKPFNGIVQFTLGDIVDSVKCGAVELKSPAIKASATSSEALKFADKPECFAPAAGVTVPLVVQVNLAYQRGKWVVKSVTSGANKKKDAVMSATLLGVAMDDIEVADDSESAALLSGWKALMTGNS